jgi:hypothetical protein
VIGARGTVVDARDIADVHLTAFETRKGPINITWTLLILEVNSVIRSLQFLHD